MSDKASTSASAPPGRRWSHAPVLLAVVVLLLHLHSDVMAQRDHGLTTTTTTIDKDTCQLGQCAADNSTVPNSMLERADNEEGGRGIYKQNEPSTSSSSPHDQPQQCTLYLAESSIPNGGLGMYTSVPIASGSLVGDPEILVPWTDRDLVRHPDTQVDDVAWDAKLHQELNYESSAPMYVFYPGFGSTVNCHMGLINVGHGPAPKFTDAAGLHRSRDPGVGAFAHMHGMQGVATTDIPAGSELFEDYGEEWFQDPSRIEEMGVVPFAEDYEHADRIVRRMREGEDEGKAAEREQAWQVLRNAATDRVRAALPPSFPGDGDDGLRLLSEIGSAQYALPNLIRSPEWLEENGLCVDNIYPDTSTLPQAGRGAFAKRFLPKGTVIAPAPVLQIERAAVMAYQPKIAPLEDDENVGRVLYNDDGEVMYTDTPVQRHLLLNYCFGHNESSLLLLPYAPLVNYLNHNGANANAKLRWSKSRLNKGKEWLDLSTEEVLQKNFGLMMEFVALRDITPGEEISIDYGREWDEAFAKHVREWTPLDNAEEYVSAADMRIRGVEIRTEAEQGSNPYPSNLEVACYYKPHRLGEDTKAYYDINEKRKVHVRWTASHNDDACLRHCRILSRTTTGDGAALYTAEVRNDGTLNDDVCAIPEMETHVVSHIPEEMFTVVDKPYSRDPYLPNAFRHEMGLPDGLFPTAWMDRPGQ